MSVFLVEKRVKYSTLMGSRPNLLGLIGVTAKKLLLDALENYKKLWSNKKEKPCYTLEPWLATIKEIISSKIKNLCLLNDHFFMMKM